MSKRIIALICFLAILVAVFASGCQNKPSNSIVIKDAVNGIEVSHKASDYSDFAVNLLKSCYDNEGNTLVSPLSVVMALAMASEGAEGNTLKELEDAIGMDMDSLRAFAYSYMSEKVKSEKLSVSNSVWVNKKLQDFYVNEDFIKINEDFYSAEVFETVFSEETVDAINKWVCDNTDGMIPEIIKTLDKDTVMVLVNALLFDADWSEPYSENQVSEGEFITEDKKTEKAQFLSNMEGCYLEDENSKGFLKYYEGFEFAFAALLPDEGLSMEEYVRSLGGEKIKNILENKVDCTVNTKLPKFEADFTASLNDALKAMGIEKAFDIEKADFSKLGEITDGNIYVSEVAHSTKISVTETGTKAGAATAVTMKGYGATMNPKEVNLDRPFVYMIIDTDNNTPIFMGTLMSVG